MKMNKLWKKIGTLGLTAAMSLTVLAGCGSGKSAGSGSSSSAKAKKTKIGVLVADVSGEEALGFRSYYEKYLAKQYGVTFTYTDKLEDAASEKSAIEKFASQGYQGVISFSSNDRALQLETCEQNKIYYGIAAGMLDDDQYNKYKGNKYFVGEIGPSMDTEYQTGVDMGKYFKDKGVKNVAIYGAFIPNPMHVYRVAGVLSGLGLSYDGQTDEAAVTGEIFKDQTLDLKKISGDINVVSYLQGYGDTTTDEANAAIQAKPDAFISVGMATTFFAAQLNQAGIEYSDIDSFTKSNGESMKTGKLVYLAGKYSSSVGPEFALMMNAINGNVIRDKDGNAPAISQGYKVATDGASFDEYYTKDNGDNPIFSKDVLDKVIGKKVTFDDVKAVVDNN